MPHKETAFSGHGYTPDAIREYKEDFAFLVREQVQQLQPLTGALKVELRIYRAKKSATSRNFGDLDNLAKPILDAVTMAGAVWVDDRQIVDLHICKFLAAEPLVEITVQELA